MATRFERNGCGVHSKPTAAALTSIGLLIPGVVLLAMPATVVAAEPAAVVVNAERGAAPRALMRLPRWIESFGSSRGKHVENPLQLAKEFPAATAEMTEAQEAPTSTDLPPAAADRPSVFGAATPFAAAQPPAAQPARPGGRLLRSHQSRPASSFVTLTGGWSEMAADEAAVEGEQTAATEETLGPDASVLQAAAAESAQATPPAAETPSAVSDVEAETGTRSETTSVEAAPVADEELPPSSFAVEADTEAGSSEPAVTDVVEAESLAEEGEPAADGSAFTNTTTDEVSVDTELPPQPALPSDTPTLSIDPASFRGVLPGTTTREELISSWGEGEPFTREDGGEGFSWTIKPFERVEVILTDDVVSSIYIRLAKPAAVDSLAEQLGIADLRTVSVLDAEGVSVGEVFPERGVIFSLTPGTRSATAVMLEPLDPEAFVLRAEGELETSMANAVADLQYAVEVDPEYQRAHRLLLVLLCDQGQWTQAAKVAAATEALAPDDSWTLLKHATVLTAMGRFDEAVARTQQVLENPETSPLVLAQAERQMGRIELSLPTPDYEKAVNHFTASIKHAAPLTANPAGPIRRAALDIQFDSHLGTALAIASGTWQQKARVLPKWIARAEGFAQELAGEEAGNPTLELRLCQGALAISAATTDADSPMPWIKRLLAVRSKIGAEMKDPWRRRQVDWEVGQALADALTAAQIRGDTSDMLDNATLTAAYLERGCEQRELTPDEKREMGDLLFRIGILYSLQNGDHETAVTWFDKVLPLWDRNPSITAREQYGRLGEAYVSMAISYWQVDRREEAVDLSSLGVDMMVTAVDASQLEEQSLAVAYGNLSTMYAEQGDAERSEMYAEMASRAEATGTRQ